MILDIIRQKRRFEMLDKTGKKDVLEMNSFFGKYNMIYQGKLKKVFTYYDTPNKDLSKSGIALFRTDTKNEHTLTMTLERLYNEDNRRLQTYRTKKESISIGKYESIFRHMDFLRNSFLDMFDMSISFDPDFLLKKLRTTYIITTLAQEYRCTTANGLKTTYSFDKDTFQNLETNVKYSGDYLTIYQHSKESTDEEFANLVSKTIRYCKSLTPIKESKYSIAKQKTIAPIIVPKTKNKDKKQIDQKK